METINSNGTLYAKASILANRHHYTTDYIGQLCRQGKIDAQVVGRAWYVNEESLLQHKNDRNSIARPVEILSKNKHEIEVTSVVPATKVEIYPRLSKTAHRMFFLNSDKEPTLGDKNWMSRSGVYYPDETAVEPQSLGVEAGKPSEVNKSKSPEIVEIPDSERFKVSITNASPKIVHLDFTDIPAVFMDGSLEIESLDTEDEYVDTETILPEEIEVEQSSILPGITRRYTAPVRKAVSRPAEPSETAVTVPKVSVTTSPNPNYISRVQKSDTTTTRRFYGVPVFLVLVAFLVAGTLVALTGHIVSDGTSTKQSVTFNMAAVFDVLGVSATRY